MSDPLRIYMACGHSFQDEQTVAEVNGRYEVVSAPKLSPVYEVVHHDAAGEQVWEHKRETITCIRCGTEQTWSYIPNG